jgi:hypothetical protein
MNSGAAQQIAIHNEAASADVPTINTLPNMAKAIEEPIVT